jgi:hypothetical protein
LFLGFSFQVFSFLVSSFLRVLVNVSRPLHGQHLLVLVASCELRVAYCGARYLSRVGNSATSVQSDRGLTGLAWSGGVVVQSSGGGSDCGPA